ncbi:MAG: hypothetical protein U0350_02725 [Caldilineaceae bacterium]
MNQRLFSIKLSHWPLLVALFVLLGGCGQLDFATGALLYNVKVDPDHITPNADGNQDVTDFSYSLRRTANVSIYFENAKGERFYFRRDRRRSAGDYDVQWGGVVDEARTVQTSYGPEEILSQVLPDGQYRWTIEAVEENGQPQTVSGAVTLQNSDTQLPELHNFAVVPQIFTPNQDAIDDRVSMSYYLTKDVTNPPLVYLENPDQPAVHFIISEKPGVAKPTERGYHVYDYDGGVDLNADPPPDGKYAVVGQVSDAAGNTIRVTRALTITEGGKPRADVAGGEIDWQGEMNRIVLVPLGGKLCFTTTVTNEGAVPIRTSGPWPGQEYKFTENSNTLALRAHDDAWLQQAGVWRFGINFDTTGVDFPFRWAVGRKEDLERRIIKGHEQWYLLPGKSGRVSGCIVINQVPPVGTAVWWGGLIHQSVDIPNNEIDRITVQVGVPTTQTIQSGN